MFLDYLEEEDGKKVVNINDVAFFAYTYNDTTGEMFVPDLFIKKEHRGSQVTRELMKEVLSHAALNKAQTITGSVFMNNSNKDKFMGKLNLYNRLGFKPVCISNNTVILEMVLGE